MQTRSQLTERRAQLELARQQLTDATHRVPSAAITKRVASIGEYLAPNSTVVTLVRQHPLRIRLEVPSARPPACKKDSASTSASTARPSCEQDASSASALKSARKTARCSSKAKSPMKTASSAPARSSPASSPSTPPHGGSTVPRSALVSFAGVERVYLVKKNGVPHESITRTGRRLDGDRVEILEGLKEGDAVVAQASDRMSKGTPVKVR